MTIQEKITLLEKGLYLVKYTFIIVNGILTTQILACGMNQNNNCGKITLGNNPQGATNKQK